MRKQILVLRDLEQRHLDKIEEIVSDYEIIYDFEEADFNRVEIVFGWDERLEKILENHDHSIKWVQSFSAGVDSMPLADLKENNITLTSASGIHSSAITESVFGMIFSYYRGIIHSVKAQNRSKWDKEVTLEESKGKTIIIVGIGKIGKQIAKVSKAFDLKTIGVNRSGNQVDYVDKLYTQENIQEALPEADIVVNILPLTEETFHFFDESLFKDMKNESLFVNVGRGETVSTRDLTKALDNENISFAALDVFEEEPLPEDHPLWKREDVLVMPHVAGYLKDYNKEVLEIFEKNYKAYINDEDLSINVVDYEKGY